MAIYTALTIQVNDSVLFNSDGTADVFKRSTFSGICHVAKMHLTKEQYDNWHTKRMLIQDAMPHLDKDEREFFLTGSTPSEWDAAFPPEEDE